MTLSCDTMRTVDEVKMICSVIMTTLLKLFYFAHQFHRASIYIPEHMSLLHKREHSELQTLFIEGLHVR